MMIPRRREIRGFARRMDHIQQKQLHQLLSGAGRTEWGRRYDFGSIRTYRDFAQRLPLQTYDDIKPYILRMINGEKDILWPSRVRWYARSSGTTNDKSKLIPITPEIRKAQYRGGFDCVALYLGNNPRSCFFSRKGLILGGSHSPSPLNSQSHYGDLSAVLIQNLPSIVHRMRVPRKEIILMDEWESKIRAIVKATRGEDVNSLSGVPSWMLTFIKALLEETRCESLTEVWPNLEVYFHGGISFEPYRDQYKLLIPSESMHYMETYNASEGFFGIQDDPFDSSLLLMPDYGIFYEFIPLNELSRTDSPRAFSIESVEVGVNYALVISTCGGLWRYLIGDTVRFTSLYPHKFVISGRTRHYINAFGEELMVDNADRAISLACRLTDAKVKEYTVAPLFMLNKARGMHEWLIEFEKMPSSLSLFADLLDRHLQELNSDYEAKRHKNLSLLPPKITIAREGIFYQWLKRKGKLGGQHKIPRLSNDRIQIEELLQFTF
ncbi:MAG: GH3 auxin-responsive promoter family protein [Tannerellaceae bacterium]|nr:GH3 auxin-responsive promoter family protein [Tannerellaceae bacterium]